MAVRSRRRGRGDHRAARGRRDLSSNARLLGGPAQIAITLLAPYVAWILAERAHTSAVLACVAGGIHVRQVFSAQMAPATRLQAKAVWDLLIALRDQGVISDEVLHRLEQELDVEAIRMGLGEAPLED